MGYLNCCFEENSSDRGTIIAIGVRIEAATENFILHFRDSLITALRLIGHILIIRLLWKKLLYVCCRRKGMPCQVSQASRRSLTTGICCDSWRKLRVSPLLATSTAQSTDINRIRSAGIVRNSEIDWWSAKWRNGTWRSRLANVMWSCRQSGWPGLQQLWFWALDRHDPPLAVVQPVRVYNDRRTDE